MRISPFHAEVAETGRRTGVWGLAIAKIAGGSRIPRSALSFKMARFSGPFLLVPTK